MDAISFHSIWNQLDAKSPMTILPRHVYVINLKPKKAWAIWHQNWCHPAHIISTDTDSNKMADTKTATLAHPSRAYLLEVFCSRNAIFAVELIDPSFTERSVKKNRFKLGIAFLVKWQTCISINNSYSSWSTFLYALI